MRNPEENIRQLLEMLDHPDAYSEQQIRDIINRDEDTRAAYRLMVEAKRSSRHRHNDNAVDVDSAWQRFLENEESGMKSEETSADSPAAANASFFTLHSSLQKIAASVAGVLLVSGLAFATIHIVRQHQKADAPRTEVTESAAKPVATASAEAMANDTVVVQPVVYDNIPLEKMLTEIAAHYDVKVTFANAEVRGLRFRFVWNPQLGIDQVVSDLNQFERLTVTRMDHLITVE